MLAPSVLREERGRLLLHVRVTPRAGRNELWLENGVVRARLTAPPVDGAANEALLRLLAERMGVSRSALTLVRGGTAREKDIAIDGLTAVECMARLHL